MKRKKLMAVLLTACMTAGMLTGCGNQAADNTGANQSAATDQEARMRRLMWIRQAMQRRRRRPM